MSYTCYVKQQDPPSLKMVPAMSVQSATGHDLCPMGLACCEAIIGNHNLNTTSSHARSYKKTLLLVLICNSYIIEAVTVLIMDGCFYIKVLT